MERLRIAIVSRDADSRLVAARAFDAAPENWDVELHLEPPSDRDHLVFGPDVEAPEGALRIDPGDPAGIVGAIADRERSRGGRTIVVTSACGGTGTTTIALHVAASLARKRATCVFDLRGGLGERLGIDPARARSWADPEAENDIELCALPAPGGFRVLLAPEEIVGDGLDRLAAARARFECLVVDAAGERLSDLVGHGETLVLVTSGSPVAARRDALLLSRVATGRLALVVNRVGRGGQTQSIELERIFGRRIALELPHCPALRDVEDENGLLVSRVHRWLRALDRLTDAL